MRFATRSHVEVVRCDRPPQFGETHDGIPAPGRDGGVRWKPITFRSGHWEFLAPAWPTSDAIGRRRRCPATLRCAGILVSQVLNLRRPHLDRWFCPEICAMAAGFGQPHADAPCDRRRQVAERNALDARLARPQGRPRLISRRPRARPRRRPPRG